MNFIIEQELEAHLDDAAESIATHFYDCNGRKLDDFEIETILSLLKIRFQKK